MQKTRLERYAPLSGLASILFLIASSGFLGIYDYLPSAERLLEAFRVNGARVILVGYLGLMACALLMWFAGSVYTELASFGAEGGRLAMIAFGGCLASAIVLGGGFTAIVAIGARAGALEGLGGPQAVTLYDLYGTLLGQMGAYTLAVFLGATGTHALRMKSFPGWFGWASFLIAIALLTPFGYSILAFAMVWVSGVSVVLYRRGTG